MPRTARRTRRSRIDWSDVEAADRIDAERWLARHCLQFASLSSWRRTSAGIMARAMLDGTCAMVVPTSAGWCIVDERGRSFAPLKSPAYFASEAAAMDGANTLPGYWQ